MDAVSRSVISCHPRLKTQDDDSRLLCFTFHFTLHSFQYSGLTGTLPHDLTFTNLKKVMFITNQLTGSLPDWVFDMDYAGSELLITDNKLSYTIPSSIGLFQGYKLSMFDNSLSGPLPSSIGDMSNLDYFNVAYNQISNTLPSEIGSLTTLETAYFTFNRISGSLPSELSQLVSTSTIGLKGNKFSGTIPDELDFLANMGTFVDLMYNYGLYGTPPSTVCAVFQVSYTYLDCF